MTESLWSDVDRYIASSLIPEDPALEAALRASDEAGLPSIQVSAAQGKFLHILARAIDAKDVLELGTLGGYSTIWLARAVAPRGGRVVTLEVSPKHAEVARANLARAGVAGSVDVRVGPALETLPRLVGHFDLAFIDADKPNIPQYFDWAVRLARPGALVIVDNVVRKGALADPNSDDENVRGVQRLHEMLAHDRRVTATTMQTVGSKGYDGFTIAIVG
jgi:predicted O-methyltransferase YrrM